MPIDKDAMRRRAEVLRRLEAEYEKVNPADLTSGESWDLDRPESPLFLGTWSEEGFRHVLALYGITDALAERGIERWRPQLDTSDPWLHTLRLWDEDLGEVFCELRARESLGKDLEIGGRLADLRFFVVEWFSLEDPRGVFTPDRPPMPGQRRPGLGMGLEVEALLLLAARRLGVSGLLSRPWWFHNACLYVPRWLFVDPTEQGRFSALVRDLRPLDLARMSWAIHLGCVTDHRGNVVEWDPGPLLLPRTRHAEKWFESTWYKASRLAARARHSFTVDRKRLEQELRERSWPGLPPGRWF